jgi:ubiquinone/menaquinone biosynthesis C-methylase UbiE
MNNNWLAKQVLINTEQWDNTLTTFYPEAKSWMSDPVSYLSRLTVDCNYLNASKMIGWDKYLAPNSTVLDVGCGGGWLTAFLSQNAKIKKLIAIDSSENYLQNFLPSVVSQLKGDISKIEAVQGFFSPVLLEDASVDLIVISSAMHHAESMSAVLSEFKRVLKPNGYLVILNETPIGNFRYLYQISKAFARIFFSIFFKKYSPFVQKISAGGFLYDPYLGDVDYPEWYWKKAIATSGFQLIQVLDTNLPTVVNAKGRSLKHFVCKK